jgi:hypothetical protein
MNILFHRAEKLRTFSLSGEIPPDEDPRAIPDDPVTLDQRHQVAVHALLREMGIHGQLGIRRSVDPRGGHPSVGEEEDEKAFNLEGEPLEILVVPQTRPNRVVPRHDPWPPRGLG